MRGEGDVETEKVVTEEDPANQEGAEEPLHNEKEVRAELAELGRPENFDQVPEERCPLLYMENLEFEPAILPTRTRGINIDFERLYNLIEEKYNMEFESVVAEIFHCKHVPSLP